MKLQHLTKMGHNRCSININGQWYVAISESGKSLGIDCWNINLYFKLFFRFLASRKVRWPIYINRAPVVAHFSLRLYRNLKSNVFLILEGKIYLSIYKFSFLYFLSTVRRSNSDHRGNSDHFDQFFYFAFL